MKKNKAKAGDFIKLTARKVSEKVQPELKVGNIYHVNRVEALKSGAAVLVLDKDTKKGTTIRCNAERFCWETMTPEQVVEENFKEQCNADTKAIMDNFTFEEHTSIAYIPLIIAHCAWVHAEKAVNYCAKNKIEAVKKLSRTVRELRTRYEQELSKDLDRSHLTRIQTQTDEFMAECAYDFTVLYHSVCNDINYQHIGISHDELRTNAFLSMMFVKACREHENRMTELIRERLGQAREGHLPFLDQLYDLMDAYLGDYKIKKTQNMDNAMKVFQKNLRRIKFQLNDNSDV